MKLLTNPIRTYDWGSRSALATLRGLPVPSPQPEAELWMGAHPSDPSTVRSNDGQPVALSEVIAANPDGLLGPAVATRFSRRLPYLMKLLAAARPLSLQVHPNTAQAQAGYAAESARALAGGSAPRTYVDPHHKPELLVALTEFDALCGFRDPEESAEILSSFGVAGLAPVVVALRTGMVAGPNLNTGPNLSTDPNLDTGPSTDTDAVGGLDPVATRLRAAMSLLLSWPTGERAGLVTAVGQAGRELVASPSGRPAHALAATLADAYPNDIGVVVALLLNQVRLRPDEAVFLAAGTLHAYLAGMGVEIMAASDNVVRGGLTSKHVDTAELMRLLRFEVMTEPVVRPKPLAPGVLGWPAPVAEFALVKASTSAAPGPAIVITTDGPRIVVCVQGKAQLSCGSQTLVLSPGESLFVAADEPSVEVSGDDAVVFHASPGSP